MGMFMSVPYVQVSGVHRAPTTHQGWILSLGYYVAGEITIIDHRLNVFCVIKKSIYKIDVDNLDSI